MLETLLKVQPDFTFLLYIYFSKNLVIKLMFQIVGWRYLTEKDFIINLAKINNKAVRVVWEKMS